MLKRTAAAMALLCACATPPGPRDRLREVREFACAYTSRATPAELAGFDLLIVEPDDAPDLAGFRGLALAYLSVGEVHETRPYFRRVPKLEENPNWPGDFRVDLRGGAWQRMVVEEILPTLAKYDGFFLDTVDSAYVTGQIGEMVALVQAIRRAAPDKIIIANNPESMVDRLDVDGVMAEAVFTTYDFEKKAYRRADPDQARQRAERYRGRVVLNLEYGTDAELVRYAMDRSRAYGFVPYVTVIELHAPTTYHRQAGR